MSSGIIKEIGQLSNDKKKVYIYAEVDIDKAYTEIISKSKKIPKFIESNNLNYEFQQKIRNYKNFRICFDSEIQKFIHSKQLSADLRLFKKNVFNSLEDYIIERYKLYIQEQNLHHQYKAKVNEVEEKFVKRMQQLMKIIQKQQK